MNFFRRFLPSTEKHLLLACDLLDLPPIVEIEKVDVQAISAGDEREIARLDAFAVQNGFPPGWAREMLAEGAQALIACDEATQEVLAMAWTINKPFHVEEIGATLDPAGGVYLFGDFVAPSHRGRKLQRLLVAERLARMSGSLRACTIIHPDNLASLRSYQSERFVPAARFVRYRWMGRTWCRCQRVENTTRTQFLLDETGTIVARDSVESEKNPGRR